MPSIAFGFDAENKAAQRAAARQAAELVTGVSTETKASLRKLIARAIKDGIPPYDAGRLIEGMVGLNRRQMEAAYNLRVRLINSGLSIDKVDKKIERYQARLLKQRGRMIARTEIMNSLANGTEESWTQAQAQGKIGANAQKEWIITPLDACNICRSIKEPVPLKMPFMSMVGPISNPTAHPNCRCAIVVVPGPAASATAPAMPGMRAPTAAPTPAPVTRPRRRVQRKKRVSKPQPLRSLNVIGGEADEALTKGIVTSQKEIAAGTTSETLLVEGKGFKGVFKPDRGAGWGTKNFPMREAVVNKKFTLAEREVFSQVVDRKLGTNMIPTTRIRDVPGQGNGSIQRFVDGADAAADMPSYWGSASSAANRDDIASQFILDLAIGNTDRHFGNFMLSKAKVKRPGVGMKPGEEMAQRSVTSIDNGLTFPAQRRVKSYTETEITFYIDRLGLNEFRNETYSFLNSRDVRTIITEQRERLLANIDATDWDKLARTTNMNGLERNAFTARMKWLRERLEKNDLFDVLERHDYHNSFGFPNIGRTPGAEKIVE